MVEASVSIIKKWQQKGKNWRCIKLVSEDGQEKVYDEFQLGSGKWRKYTEKDTIDKREIILAVKEEYENFRIEGVIKIQIRNMHYKLMERPELNLGKMSDPYKTLDAIITAAREHEVKAEPGEPNDKYWIPDEWWEDRKRRTPDPRPFRTPDQHVSWMMAYHIEGWVDAYPRPIWYDQNDKYIELWTEKDTMVGLLQQLVTNVFGVKNAIPVVSVSGFDSRSHSLKQIKRLLKHQRFGRKIIIAYLGDYDPSGLRILKDVEKRLREAGVTNYEIQRVGITLEQIRGLGLHEVTDPAKLRALANDNNGPAFERMPGHDGRRFCVEVDSMSSGPGLRELKEILRTIKYKYWDQETWDKYKDIFTPEKVKARLIAQFVEYAREMIDISDNPLQSIEEFAASLQDEYDEIDGIDGGNQPVEGWDAYEEDDDE
jgi:hypothetical protein